MLALTPPKIPLLARPPKAALVVLCLLGMVLLWTILCGISHTAPDLDGMEELVWAASLELGYTKHPPLPSWFMHFATELLGRPVWLPFFMGQLFSALGLWFVWKLGCEFTTRHRALMAMLLVSVTAYFSLRGTIYNHNTAQLWSITASIWLFYRALRDNRVRTGCSWASSAASRC
ncbi:4-amino-4-deoxy-L-arabinose transferase-like glycosyltransferase OS=Castellaniella defragrans OX=75697 GN=HNR28_003518 PE=4 SV=1 [Castellaniella defragrans]